MMNMGYDERSNRYVIATGKYGMYFHDTKTNHDLTLQESIDIMNSFESNKSIEFSKEQFTLTLQKCCNVVALPNWETKFPEISSLIVNMLYWIQRIDFLQQFTIKKDSK